MRTFLLLIAGIAIANTCFAQKPVLKATKVTTPPKIDGHFDDEAWKNSPAVGMTITYVPDYGKEPTERTEVHLVYDNTAVYIGAYMYDSEPDKINHQLSERDGFALADNFTIGLDTYDDDLNGYRFIVSVTGVQIDQRITIQNNDDRTWDAVWQSATSTQSDGWVAEMKIPYSAIRFPSKPIQDWGLQFAREIVRKGELDLWSPVDPKVSGIINQWGTLEGLENITPPLRLSLSPYLTAGVQMTPISDDPVEYVTDKILGGGADIKWGINEAFTLDATLIPDFGQVQSDNVVLNISPFETKFDEKRPFFTEGVELFNQDNASGGGNFRPQLFYSRRIGGFPINYYAVYDSVQDGETVISNPLTSKLYNATKISGRTNGGLGIGVLNAISRPTFAEIKNDESGEIREIETAPLTNYNIFVFDQSLKNNSKISFENTNTWRDGDAADANVSSIHYRFRNKANSLEATGFTNYSIRNDHDWGEDLQQGYFHNIDFSEIKGKFTTGGWNQLITPEYDQNDLGISFFSNQMTTGYFFSYLNQELKEGSFNLINYWGSANYKNQIEPWQYTEVEADAGFFLQKRNFFNFGLNLYGKPFWYYDYYEPRVEGRKFHHPPFMFGSVYFNTDYRKKTRLSMSFGLGESPVKNDPFVEMDFFPQIIINDHFSFWYDLYMSHDNGNFGFVDFDENDEIIFGRRKSSTVSNTLNTTYTFNPRMNLSFRARYYWGKVKYDEYYELLDDGDLGETTFDGEGAYDINFNIFNIDALYAWEFAPGSFLNLIWKNNIFQSDDIGEDDFFVNCSKTFTTPSANGISVKVIYYFDYLYLKKKSA